MRQRVVRVDGGQARVAAHRQEHRVVALPAVADVLVQLRVVLPVVRVEDGEWPPVVDVRDAWSSAGARHGNEQRVIEWFRFPDVVRPGPEISRRREPTGTNLA